MNRREFLKGAAVGAVLPFAAGAKAAEGLPIAGEFDLVVAGGSSTGVCAAVTAARAGLNVALVEYNAFFGGMATAGLVPVWHSLWSMDGKTQIIRGITEEIERYMLERGAYGALRVMVNCNQMGEAAARHVAGMLKSAGARPNYCT